MRLTTEGIETPVEENVERPEVNVQPATARRVRHLYVHIPFCARICPYCAFYKVLPDAEFAGRFCEALLAECDFVTAKYGVRPETIFFGGGTPTALSTTHLGRVLAGLRERLDLSALREWTVEANPGSVSARKAALLCELGVTRVSLGVQSWDDDLLKLLGREHDAAQAATSYRIIRETGFESVSLDLMFGLPGQTLAQWEATLERTIALEPDHVSAYSLTYEENTEFFLRQTRGKFRADVNVDAAYFETAMEMLEAAGYRHYETSNYARPGHESLHNRAYWAGADYVGLGPSAFSTVGFRRWQNVADYRRYSDCILAGRSVVSLDEALTSAMKRAERVALSLRTREGVPAEWLEAQPTERDEFVALALLERSGDRFALTAKGKLLADTVAS
ncbi:MAG: radical SAM family heme chaperone HemW, partial [Verrucomicrobiota bacterium]|nr:radical SAM family heme chaperone HemW [Verrucomicrobiota bacterium]